MRQRKPDTIEITVDLIDDQQVDGIVEYLISGSYTAATRDDPPEYPECEIISVKLCGIDIESVLKKNKRGEVDYDYIIEKCFEEEADGYDGEE